MDNTTIPPAQAQSTERQNPSTMARQSPKRSRFGGNNLGESSARGGRGRGNPRGNQRGGAKGRGRQGGRNSRQDMGRAEWSRNSVDKRTRNNEDQQAAKRRKDNNEEIHVPIYATQYTKEEIESEEKKPKRKVAVMIGNHTEKTIEGDLFSAFVAAGAISKANADDPKKSSLIRCARTDKGVHAAGNLISLKLIIEDEDIVGKINAKLSPQIRVFGIARTNGSFSAYQFCDSRIYEYLIPTHCFLPPHPDSFLAKKLVELADEADDIEGFQQRQSEVSTFWAETEEKCIKPILDELDPDIRPLVLKALYEPVINSEKKIAVAEENREDAKPKRSADDTIDTEVTNQSTRDQSSSIPQDPSDSIPAGIVRDTTTSTTKELSPIDQAIKELKTAYLTAKSAYRIHPDRLSKVRSTLSRFIGTHSYHNYTVQKSSTDASAKRIIRTFTIADQPLIINNTEWLSLKVHGQSFMMHQIRKMVSMAALVVRCGCHEERLQDSYGPDRMSIPKAPGLGLLLERPVFDVYNEKLVGQFGREGINFAKYEKEMEEFKQKEIYERIFREEEKENQFHSFFASIDNLRSSQLLYLSSMGIAATKRTLLDAPKSIDAEKAIDESSSEDNDAVDVEDG